MHVNRAYQKYEVPQYVDGLLKCTGRKVCTNLATTLNVSHDKIYNTMQHAIQSNDETVRTLESIAHTELDAHNINLVIDDSLLVKLYAKQIEGLEIGFDGSTKRPCAGIRMVTALLTDTDVRIPIGVTPYTGKELSQDSCKSKSQLAIEITKNVLSAGFKIKRLIADAHFSTTIMIDFLLQQKQNFLMKITRRRKITINGQTEQLQEILRLKRNNHTAVARGIIDEMECYFYAIRVLDESTVYFISNDYIDPHTVVKLYRIRWNIEIFHRTAKQYLGLGECQMLAIEKQRQHALFVMHAYALASVERRNRNFECVEDVIKLYRIVKSIQPTYSNSAPDRDCNYAA